MNEIIIKQIHGAEITYTVIGFLNFEAIGALQSVLNELLTLRNYKMLEKREAEKERAKE